MWFRVTRRFHPASKLLCRISLQWSCCSIKHWKTSDMHFLYLFNKCITWSRCVVSSQRTEATGSSAGYVLAEGTWSWSCETAWPEGVDSWLPSPAPPWWSGSSVLWPGGEPPCPGSTESLPQTRWGHGTHGTCCECQTASHNAARCRSSWSSQEISLESWNQERKWLKLSALRHLQNYQSNTWNLRRFNFVTVRQADRGPFIWLMRK